MCALPVAVVALVLACGTAAFAHAIVRDTAPADGGTVDVAPERVVMRFNEPIEIQFGAIRVFDAAGQRVDEGDAEYVGSGGDAVAVQLQDRIQDGTYTVSWRIVSADGHPISEAFVFHVGAPSAGSAGQPAHEAMAAPGAGTFAASFLGITRWMTFAGLLLLIGSAVFLVMVWRRPGSVSMRPVAVEASFVHRWRTVVICAWWTTFVFTAVSIPFQGAVAANVPLGEALSPDVVVRVLSTRFGVVALARLLLLMVLVAVARPVARRAGGVALGARPVAVGAASREPSLPAVTVTATAVLLAALAVTPGLAGHAGTTPPVAVNLPVDGLHVVAAGAWLGGLVYLLGAAFPATAILDGMERVTTMAPVVRRFSRVAAAAVGLLVLTGIWRSWTEVRTLAALTDTPYGWTLLAKVALFVPLLALGAINHRRLRPWLDRAAAAGDSSRGSAALVHLRRSVATEILLGVAVVTATAVLVNLAPARTEASMSEADAQQPRLGAFLLDVGIEPSQVGDNEIDLMITTSDGADAGDIEAVRVLFRMPERDIGPVPARAQRVAPGRFRVEGHQLSVPGQWELEVVARVGRFDEVRTTVGVMVDR